MTANSLADVTARCLESCRPHIISAYEQRLKERHSRLVADPVAWQQVSAHAGEIFDVMLENLRNGRQTARRASRVLAKDIGAARAAHGVHPVESLRAAEDLFQILVSAVTQCLAIGEEEAVAFAVLATHHAMSLRLEDAAISYYGFLLDKLHGARIDERQHVARELHDRVGTGLAVTYRQLELCEMSLEGSPANAAYRIERAQRALVEAMDEVRRLMVGLRATEPVESLGTELRNFVDSVALDTVAMEVLVSGDEAWAAPHVRSEVFLVVREALRNAMQHSRASAILARITIAPHELWAEVHDDGIGFEPLVAARDGTGTGLPSMRERVAMLAGTFRLSSLPEKGTLVEIQIPLGGAEDAAR